MDRIAFEVLGPLRVPDPDGTDVAPRGRLQRRLLAALVLEIGRVVSSDRLVELLWPDGRGTREASTLHSPVFRLRQQLGGIDIHSTGSGYVLAGAAEATDAWQFETAVGDAAACREDDPAEALEILDGAVAAWRGTPYPELDDDDAGRIEVARLLELRLHAEEERFAALLRLGRAADVVADLEAHVAREPLRERPREQLMEALATTGRRVDSLRVYDAYRRLLAEEIGIDPSAHLQVQHRRLLDAEGPGDVGPQPAQDGGRPPTSVPRPISSFVGRSDAIAELVDLVGVSRIVTLVGPGGVGKTRLATELVHAVRDDTSGPVWFCDLTAATEDDVATTVASALSVQPRMGVGLVSRIAEVVRHDPGLLVLDNCEHVLDEVAALAEEVLVTTSQLTIIATSRERLAIDGERVFGVDPLPATGEDSPAVALFTERAAASGWAAEPGDRELAQELCARLDGLPLALELAAGRLRSMSLVEVAAGLARSTSILRGGRRTLPRHRSLDDALSWSYRFLGEGDREVLAAAATFAGSFAVVDVVAVSRRDDAEVEERLHGLVDCSLVHRIGGRFRLLQVVRQFVNERPGDAAVRARMALDHARRVAERAERCSDDLRTSDDGSPARETKELVPDLRQAMTTALAAADADLAIGIVMATRDVAMNAMLPELLGWGEAAGHLGEQHLHPLAGEALSVAALGAWHAGDVDRMRQLLEQAHLASGSVGRLDRYEYLSALGTLHLARGSLEDAVREFRRALACEEAEGDVFRQAETGATLAISAAYAHTADALVEVERLAADVLPACGAAPAAWCWYAAGECLLDPDPHGARTHLERALEMARASGITLVEGVAGASLASLDVRQGDMPAAVERYRWLLPLWLRAGVRTPLRTMLRTVVELLCQRGLDEPAARLLGAVTAPGVGHEIVGDDDVRIGALREALVHRLGSERIAQLVAEGSTLDDAAAASVATAAFDVIAP